MIPRSEVALFRNALPFGMSLLTVPLAVIGTLQGGWTGFLLPAFGWLLFDIRDLCVIRG